MFYIIANCDWSLCTSVSFFTGQWIKSTHLLCCTVDVCTRGINDFFSIIRVLHSGQRDSTNQESRSVSITVWPNVWSHLCVLIAHTPAFISASSLTFSHLSVSITCIFMQRSVMILKVFSLTSEGESFKTRQGHFLTKLEKTIWYTVFTVCWKN